MSPAAWLSWILAGARRAPRSGGRVSPKWALILRHSPKEWRTRSDNYSVAWRFPSRAIDVGGFLLLLGLGLATARAGVVASSPWLADLSAAQTMAKKEGKSVLIHFSGSDWCGWCMKLRKEVFNKPEFDAYAKSNLVLVIVDFPKHKTVPASTQSTNQRVAEQFQVQGFPTLVLLDSQGNRLGNVNYAQGGPKAFLAELEKLIHPPRELPPPAKVRPPGPVPFRRVQTTVRPPEPEPNELTLRRITRSKQGRQAVINDRTLSAGQTATVKVAAGHVRVQCVEIRDRSVVVNVKGERATRELKLLAGT